MEYVPSILSMFLKFVLLMKVYYLCSMKHIRSYEDYLVDELSNVYSKRRGSLKKLKPILTHYGYYEVNIVNSERKFRAKIHRLVAEVFISNPNGLPQINHKDGNKLNNNVENLEWCTAKDNLKHARETGLNSSVPNLNGKGTKNSRSILTEEKVLKIRENIDDKTHKELALEYGVAESTISGIIARLRWIHI